MAEKMRVLIVDDEIDRLLQRELERQGCEVEYTASVEGVAARVSERAGEPYELLLLNLDMPAVNGLELLKDIGEAGLDLDVIVITGDIGEDQAIEAIRLGAIDYLHKPISLEKLRTALFRVRQRRAAEGKKVLKPRILVVDDEEDLVARIKRELEREGYEVVLAYDGAQGLEYFENNHVDVAIADIRMPEIDGLEMVAECRAINLDFAAVIITGFSDQEKAIKSLRLGVFEYLMKPISLEELISVVNKALDVVALRRGLSVHQRELEIESALKTRYVEELERKQEAVRKSEGELRERSDELEKVNKELEDYTYIVSHDLRAPLRSIQSFTSFLIEDYGDKLDEQGRNYLERLKKSSLRMQQLIGDLLTLSRIGKRHIAVEMVDLNRLLEAVKDDLKGQIDKAGAEIIIHDLPTISTQRTWIGQLFRNLIDNAVRFNQSKLPRVEIECEEREYDYLFKVKDNGIGIEEKYYSRVFNIFDRLHPQTEYGGGTGAGLAICKKIAESWGGKIWVQSKVGEGSIFCFNIPKVSKLTL